MQGPQSTDALVRAMGAVRSRMHLSLRQALLRVAGPFPLAGAVHWSNDWHAYRPCPYPHVHLGLDLLAPRGTPIVAVADAGVTELVNDPRMAGLGVGITAPDGTRYFYAHMERIATGLRVGLRVRVGQVIGFVGNTGDAAGGPTHLHFEVRPNGVPVPPKPYVDRWLLRAEAKAKHLRRTGGVKRRTADAVVGPRPMPLLRNPLREQAPLGASVGAVDGSAVTAPTPRPWPVLLANEASRSSGPIFVLVVATLVPPALRLWIRRRRRAAFDG
jgi:murein DD-endopeptidase MepM/ murein hydrolase activator NlpD